jgi:glycosyltransferase involved in cell wall biosynthesis
MKVLIDLRCLNYNLITGVNAYTINLLHCLWEIKKENNSIKIYSVGLKPKRIKELKSRFVFLANLFEENISLSKHLNLGNLNEKITEIILLAKYSKNSINKNISKFDYVLCPQPRLLPTNPDSKVITVVHDLFFLRDNSGSFLQKFVYSKSNLRTVFENSEHIIANSYSTAIDIQKLFPKYKPKINLVYPALPNISRFEDNTIIDTKNLALPQSYYLALSGIEPRKNWKNLILAHNHTNKKNQNENWLILAGKIVDHQYYNSLLSLISKYNIKNIRWVLSPNENQKSQLLENCKFLVYPSIYEGFGFPILESYEFNKPVVTSAISSMGEVAKNGAIFCNPFDFVSISNSIMILLEDQKFYEKLVLEIIRTKHEYTWNELKAFMDKVLEQKNST